MKGNIYVKRPKSGLLEPFDVPELTLDAAVERGWELHGDLLGPRPLEQAFLTTRPVAGFTLHWYWGARCLEPGQLLQGLPVL
jgi:hypothetical protein